MERQAEELIEYLKLQQDVGLYPVVWVGAGASAAAGYPTLAGLESLLREHVPDLPGSGFTAIDAFVEKYTESHLAAFLQKHLGEPRPFAPIHGALARLAAAGVCPILFTTNYDRLIENALTEVRVRFVVQALQDNYALQALQQVQVLKLHGDVGDWKKAVLTSASYRDFEATFPLLYHQLDQSLRTRPVIFVGCSMRDPRLLDWLGVLSVPDRRGLFGGRALLTRDEWNRLPAPKRDLLASANIKPILVDDHASVTGLLHAVAERLAPLPSEELVFDLNPGEETWTVVGPTPESAPHQAPNPLADAELLAALVHLRDWGSRPISVDDPQAPVLEQTLDHLARQIARPLTATLFSEAARQAVVRRMNQVEKGRARLTLRVEDRGPLGDRALALPWELLIPDLTSFAVREGRLDVVREAVTEGAKELEPPIGPLTVAVTIAAPEDQTALNYENEAFRVQAALSGLGQRAAFADLGGVDDLVEVVEGQKAGVIHFSGHGLPGRLVFENDEGFSDIVPVEDLLRRLNETLLAPGRDGTFPRLFFLASCYGATGAPASSLPEEEPEPAAAGASRQARGDLDAALGRGPSTAATLHRSGFVQVIGYFGPVGDELCTRAEEAFYRSLAEGDTALQAATEARATLSEPLERHGVRSHYPFGWAQLAVYHRGPDLPLAVKGKEGKTLPARFRRQTVQVSGLPVLDSGFIGRRALQHEVRRRVRNGQQLIVLQGLGGLGKTALASQLLSRVFAKDPSDALILRCQGLDPSTADPISKLRTQAEDHGHGFPGWDERMKVLRENIADPAEGFAATIEEIRKDRPKLVLYADNAETLQTGPKGEDPEALGSWRPEAEAWWRQMERLVEGGLILISTRYAWEGLDPDAWIGIDPMSPADLLRMLDSFESFEKLPRPTRERLAETVDGHPRTLEFLDVLVKERRRKLGLGYEVSDTWADLIEPVLPKYKEKVSADLLLGELWNRFSPEARAHAGQVSVLLRPTPRFVIDRLGKATAELIGTGVLTHYRERFVSEEGSEWIDRWGLHSLVKEFVSGKLGEDERRHAHLTAGLAYEEWVKKPGARWSDQVEGIEHLHGIGEGDRAWLTVQEYVFWLRDKARYREAWVLLESCEAAGTSDDRLARALVLLVQMRGYLGERKEDLNRLLDRALTLAGTEETKGIAFHEQGSLLSQQGKYVEAESLLRQSLSVKEKSLGKERPSYGASLQSLAGVLSKQGKDVEAEFLLRQSLSVIEKSFGKEHPDYGAPLHSLAGVLSQQGKYVEAESLLRQSLSVIEKFFGKEHPSYGASLHSLAGVLSKQGKYVEAESFLRQSLSVYEKSLGKEHPDYGVSLHSLAGVLSQQDKYVEAESLLRQSLSVREKSLGKEHPLLCPTLANLATVLLQQGKPEESEPLLQCALGIARGVFSDSGPDVAQILNLLAPVQFALGRPEAADTAWQALEGLISAFGLDHPITRSQSPILQRIIDGTAIAPNPLSQLATQARSAAERGDYPAAITAQERVVETFRQAGEEREALVALSVKLFNLAGYYSNAGRHEAAVTALEEVVALDERTEHADLESDRTALERARQMAALTPEQRARLAVVSQIESLADQARDGAIAALRGEADREELIESVESVATQAAEGEVEGSRWLDLAKYLRAVVGILRGEMGQEVPSAFAERFGAIRDA